ncbi:DUF485 domain-containing protein [Streptomyces marispadix]|uniref:DUF485 domain-containing protein n=1 Tax=Streptomyces marispadix TaxID=2922868 RepID=A0ABS9T3E6_9ACTN|nr:DUF485 domain-containing protein [Streptomyces marispadix]MCH6163046.1 DUF485 domain-containing protein [Streptomyces marispadix]
MRTDDPWYDALASGWGDHDAPPPAAEPAVAVAVPRPRPFAEPCPQRGESDPSGEALPGAGDRGSAAESGEAPGGPCPGAHDARTEVYLAVQRSEPFQRVRRRYRRFVLPVSAAFLTWYLAYVVAATAAPGLMARPVAGVFNVAMAAGLAQFASTFLLTWAYVRHARLRRDELALELRWETQDLARTRAAAVAPGGSAASARPGYLREAREGV